jgi:myo-inositol-1(or 4)-monophosphatase
MYTEYLEIARNAATTAGAIQLEGLTRNLKVMTKSSPIDLVTEVDQLCEAEIARLILENFPTHQILAEEGSTGGDDPAFRWIIDPLDGTTNYTHRYPYFSVSIGLEHKGRVIVGVVYNAVNNEMFWATEGGGAFLNGAPIHVSEVPSLNKALLCTGFPGDQAGNKEILGAWERISLLSHGIRRDGSAALDLCSVACGRFDGFWEKLNAWDMAAGSLIVTEAGGHVCNFVGEAFDMYKREIVATNGLIYPELIQALAESKAE